MRRGCRCSNSFKHSHLSMLKILKKNNTKIEKLGSYPFCMESLNSGYLFCMGSYLFSCLCHSTKDSMAWTIMSYT